MDRVTHQHVEQACQRYNKALGFRDHMQPGYLQWSDIRGDGSNRRGLYVTINENGGVSTSNLRGKTMRETVAILQHTIRFHKSQHFVLIINAIHERGPRQIAALAEMARRGLWLSDEQRQQAGLA